MKFTSKKKFDLMGQIIVVTKIVKTRYVGSKREMYEEKLSVPRPGWVVGYRNIQQGKRFYEDEVGYIFEQCGKPIQVLKVCFWNTYNPINVPLDGWKHATENDIPYPTTYNWSIKDRDTASEQSKWWPRDSKGRWI